MDASARVPSSGRCRSGFGCPKGPSSSEAKGLDNKRHMCTCDGVSHIFDARYGLHLPWLGTPDEVPRRDRAHRSSLPPHGLSVCEYLHCITLLQFLPHSGPLHHPAAPSQPASRLRSASSPVPSASPTFLPFSPLLHFISDIIPTTRQPSKERPPRQRISRTRIAGQMNRRRLGRRLCALPDTRLD